MRFTITFTSIVAVLSLLACEPPEDCNTCNESEGTEFCVTCETSDSCTASIRKVDSGEVLFSCEEAVGESCATDELVASCPDL